MQALHKSIFCIKYFTIGQEGRDALTKEMNQIYRQICFEPININYVTTQDKRRSQLDIIITVKISQQQKSK